MRMDFAIMAVITGLIGSLLFPAVLRAQDNGCKPNEILVAEDENNWYCKDVAAYQKTRGPELVGEYCSAKLKVGADQSAIRNLGFAVDTERFEMYRAVATDQRSELKNKVMMEMVGNSLKVVGNLADSARPLNPWSVNKSVKMLEDNGFGNPALIAALRNIALVRGKPAMAAAYAKFEKLAESGLEGYSTGRGVKKDPGTWKLQLLAGALKVMQGNEAAGLVITGAEFSESLAYLYYVGGQVDALDQITDDKLANLARLGERLKDDVDDMVSAKQSWQSEMDVPVAPSCAK